MTFQSPQLPVHEIVTAFKEFDIDVSEHDFRQPDPRRWREVYATMYEALTGRSIESAIQTMLKEIKLDATNPEACEEAAGQIAFTQCLQRVMNACGYKNFSQKDVIRPDPKGVRRIASVFINRSRHDTRVLDFLGDIQERAQKSQGEYESVLRKNKELNQRQSADEANYVHRKAELQKLEDDAEEGNKVLAELQASLEEDKRSVQDLKLNYSEMESQKAALKQIYEQKSQECEKLSRKIVQSPKKFQVELDRLKKKVMDMKSQLSKEEQVLSESRMLLEHSMNKTDAAAKAVKLAIEVQTDFDKDIEICNEIKGLTEKHADLQDAINSCFIQEEDLVERFRVRQAQRHTLTSHCDLRQQSNLQKLADFRGYSEKLKESTKSVMNEASTIKDKMSQLKLKISELDSRVALERENLQKEKDILIEMVDKVEELCEQGIEKIKATSSFEK